MELFPTGVSDEVAVNTGFVLPVPDVVDTWFGDACLCELASRVDLCKGRMLGFFVMKESALMHELLGSLLGLVFRFLFGEGLLSLSLFILVHISNIIAYTSW